MRYAIFNNQGLPTAFYCLDVHGDKIPPDAIKITEEQWLEFIENQGARQWVNGQVVEYSPPVIEQPEPVIIVPAVALWERLTDAEAEQVEAAMATKPFRTRQIFLTANTFRSDHELWPLLEQMATDLFGEERAAELLSPE
ncbi:hypothetical protein [Brucella pseudintermedia]|uniref:hypothetical protein n=1 Tax=Brucella pseudintermedia TaxID=370111 RepID=UPI001F22392D|nr:hypothetical protein [Brucella pseudintermedia]